MAEMFIGFGVLWLLYLVVLGVMWVMEQVKRLLKPKKKENET